MGVKRAIILRVRLTFIENALIKSRAKAVGLTKSRFVRQIALGSEIKLKQFTEEEKQLFRVLAGLAGLSGMSGDCLLSTSSKRLGYDVSGVPDGRLDSQPDHPACGVEPRAAMALRNAS